MRSERAEPNTWLGLSPPTCNTGNVAELFVTSQSAKFKLSEQCREEKNRGLITGSSCTDQKHRLLLTNREFWPTWDFQISSYKIFQPSFLGFSLQKVCD